MSMVTVFPSQLQPSLKTKDINWLRDAKFFYVLCSDIDECGETSLLNTCGALQHCVNLPGNFHCTCIQGYKMSTEGCVGLYTC